MKQQGKREVDVVVLGGGPSGVCAALAAARMGARTALLERHSVLGGMGTAALVNNFCPAFHDGYRFIIGGLFAEIRQALIDRKALYANLQTEPYDPDVFATLLMQLALDSGIEVHVEARVAGTDCVSPHQVDVDVVGQAGYTARLVVDASGDAGFASAAGIPLLMAENGRKVMPLTYCYIMGPVDIERVRQHMPDCVYHDAGTGEDYVYVGGNPRVNQWVRDARAKGTLSIPRDHVSVAMSIPGQPTMLSVNFGRVPVNDPTDPDQLRMAGEIGRRQVQEGIEFFRAYLPGFENVALVQLARQIGVRESRRLVGRYVLTGEDLIQQRQFEDVIAQCCYPIDIHDPESDRTRMIDFPKGAHYDIPWRSLIPASGPGNWLLAGRCISATQEAMSSFRVSPSMMAIGEAAGITAALAVQQDAAVGDVSAKAVQERLREVGAILD